MVIYTSFIPHDLQLVHAKYNAHFKKNNHASSDYIEIFVTEACTDQILLINSFQSIIAFHLKTCHALQNK